MCHIPVWVVTKTYAYNDYMGYELASWYNFRNKGTNPTYNEDNFGIVNMDYTPKLAYVALAQLCKNLNSARYIGKYSPAEGLDAFVYTKDNKPFAVMWATEGTVTYDFGNKAVTVEDNFGNPVEQNGQVEFGEEPYYVFGIDENMAAKAAFEMISEDLEKYRTKWQDKLDMTLLSGLESKLSVKTNISQARAYEVLNEIFKTGDKILEWNKDWDKASFEDTMCMLYQIYEINKKYMNYCAYRTEDAGAIVSDKLISELSEKIYRAKNYDDTVTLNFTETMLKYANRNLKNAKDISSRSFNPAQSGLVNAYDALAKGLCGWAEKVCEVEAVNKGYSILTYAVPGKLETAQGRTGEVEVTIQNESAEKIDGELLIYDENGELACESVPVSIESGNTESYKIGIHISTDTLSGEREYTAKLVCNGEVLKQHILPVNVTREVDVKLLATECSIKDYKKVQLLVTPMLEDDVSGSIEVIPPEGWSLAESKKSYSVKAGENLLLEFDVNSAAAVPFNEYVFRVIVKDKDGVLVGDNKLPLNFLRIVRTYEELSTENFDGSMDDWANAYPIHIGTPEEADQKAAWIESNIAARAFLKWDEKHLYILADVYDDYHMQVFGDYDMWRGDSIQISLDPLADGGTVYGPDDYEIGFAFNGNGNVSYGYTAANGKIGTYSGTLVSVKRDSDKKITRYLIKLSNEDISPMKLEQGHKFGFNMVFNDADMLQRDRYVQFTRGTGDKKYPDWYEKFILSPYEAGMDAAETNAFDIYMNNELVITNAK